MFVLALAIIWGAYIGATRQFEARITAIKPPAAKAAQSSILVPLKPGVSIETVELEVELGAQTWRTFHVIPDNCLIELTINNRLYPPSLLPLCDYNRGHELDLSSYLVQGRNRLLFRIQNQGGPGKLELRSSLHGRPFTILRLLAALLTAIGCILYLRSLRALVPRAAGAGSFIRPLLGLRAGIAVILLAAVALRLSVLRYQSGDMDAFLIPWTSFISSHGGFSALAYAFSDYAPSYLYLLVALHYASFLVSPAIGIKLLSILADFLLAFGTWRLLRRDRQSTAPLGALAVLLAPTVVMNGAVWGQCDAIYTAFLLLALSALIRSSYLPAFAWLGVALSFKLQAVFLAPLFLVVCLLGAAPFTLLFLPALVFVASLIPAWIAGRPLLDLLLIYANQAGGYEQFSLQAPTFFAWLPNSVFSAFGTAGLIGGLAVTLGVCLLLGSQWRALTRERIVATATFFAILVPFLLPKMHERYFFPADVLSIIFALYFPRWFIVPLLVQICSGFSYLPFLMGSTVIPVQYLSFGVLAAILCVGFQLYQLWRPSPLPNA